MIKPGDALLIVDPQVDFITGSLAVPGAKDLVPLWEKLARAFHARDLVAYASRDWHPPQHCSFIHRSGKWPVHCVEYTQGAQFAINPAVYLAVISKGEAAGKEAYSAFENTSFVNQLVRHMAQRLFVCGVATEYCVRSTVLDARRLLPSMDTIVLDDAIVGLDGAAIQDAVDDMLDAGALFGYSAYLL